MSEYFVTDGKGKLLYASNKHFSKPSDLTRFRVLSVLYASDDPPENQPITPLFDPTHQICTPRPIFPEDDE